MGWWAHVTTAAIGSALGIAIMLGGALVWVGGEYRSMLTDRDQAAKERAILAQRNVEQDRKQIEHDVSIAVIQSRLEGIDRSLNEIKAALGVHRP
jgi:hypothetical protein